MSERADHIKAVMIATFKRKGSAGERMRAFDELPQAVQSALIAKFQRDGDDAT